MIDQAQKLARSYELSAKVSTVLQKRLQLAQEHFGKRVQEAYKNNIDTPKGTPISPWYLWQEGYDYAVDSAQRTILFWDTLRQRGNNFIAQERAGKQPSLHFDYETVLDAREFARPVNYALVRIVPPEGMSVDSKRRPYVMIDPRAGHGPGIGGFKDDSQVGVALREGHPVYFVIFFPDPEPGQTLLDVCETEATFVRKVRELHPDSPKPAIVGNCQGGWAAMMLAASRPEDTGPIVINGAPMSYWGGAWAEGEGDNPMRYSAGLLGGTWLGSFTADLANGKFDGAWLVQNFENLNPANTFWDKYYHLFANIDTEPPRFLDFERWWGGYYFMNREEIEWITQNLFVGNKLWSGGTKTKSGTSFDLREIKSPIILFASLGDNITPPEQAFNWVGDTFGSTEEIKARGHVIVGLLHQDVGHLGIFVSGKVAKKEHSQVVSVLKSIETLPPGLYGMQIKETRTDAGKTEYKVDFVERRLEDVMQRLNRFERADEKPFEAAAAISEFNQRAYELFAQPLAQAMANERGAELQKNFHSLRFQRWAVSDLNPWLWWLGPTASMIKVQRRALGADRPGRKAERIISECVSASLDYYREVRDAMSEAAFFQTYGHMFSFYIAGKHEAEERKRITDPRELSFVREALASIAKGGYAEALARVGALLTPGEQTIPLAQNELKTELIADYASLIPELSADQRRRVRGGQEVIVQYEPERALETLPQLLPERAERERLLMLIETLFAGPRMQQIERTPEQLAMLKRIRGVLGAGPVEKLSGAEARVPKKNLPASAAAKVAQRSRTR
jgi:pimeloyl-ACP methyl ester carboxylesterase